MRPRLSLVSMIAVLAALYFEAGHLGLKLAFVHASASAVWPPTGIALAALLIFGLRVWPGIFIGAFLVNVTAAGNVATSLCVATGNTLEAVAGMALVSRFAAGRDFPHQSRAYLLFVVLAGVLATTISATIGVGSLTIAGFADPSRFGSIWLHWWLGNAAGAILIAPMLVAWHADPRLGWSRRMAIEAALLLGAIVSFGELVFGGVPISTSAEYPTAFLVMPLLLWPAFRFGPRETATATFLLAGLALQGTLQGSGPFATGVPLQSLLSLQSFMGVVAVTSMAIAATTLERKRSTAELWESRRELQARNAQLLATCVSDPLTGVANRRGFEARLKQEVARSHRSGATLALMIVDVDRFKRHNQSLGHGGADGVLKRVASLLAGEIRQTDHLARFGGDEFVILLPDTPLDGARAIAERCRRTIATHSWQKRSVTVSIGIGSVRGKGTTGADLLAEADEALYRAKDAGRNRIAQGTIGKPRKSQTQNAVA